MDTIVIRPMEPRDAEQAAHVWCDGLQQTVDAAPPEKRQEYKEHFDKSVEKECAEGGMVGIKGQGLIDFYCNNQEDHCMFVAVQNDEVLGLVGIKRGMDYIKDPIELDEDYKWCSIWKMSVTEQARNKKIGSRLMQACEEWARGRDPNVEAIRLYTGNPIAASFYIKIGFTEMEKTDHYGIYENKLV